MRKFIKPALTAAVFVAGMMAVTSASAAIVCNADGDCWHVKGRYTYRPEFGVTVHPNNWRWGGHDHFRWREHDGRGYWRGGVWVGF
jgi:hypothetical protein